MAYGPFVTEPTVPFINFQMVGGLPGNSAAVNSIAYAEAVAALGASGGIIAFGPGTYKLNPTAINPLIIHDGAGPGITILQLANGANADLFSGQTGMINLAAARASGPDGTLYGFGWRNMTLDGNKANQSGGPCWCLRFYGYGFTLDNVEIANGFSGGALIDWNGTGIHNHNGVEARFRNVTFHDASGIGLQIGGPHDSQFINVETFSNGGHGLHIAPNAAGLQFNDFHEWGNFGTGIVGTLIEAGDCEFENAVFESPSDATKYCIVLAAKNCKLSGKCLSSGAFSGILLGQNSAETPITGQILQGAGVTTFNACDGCDINMIFEGCTGTNGSLNFDTVHFGKIKAIVTQASGSAYTGFLDPTNQYELLSPNGLTPDGTVGKGGQTRVAADSNNAFTVGGTNQYKDYFNVVTHSNPRFEMPNGVYLQFYSDQYTTTVGEIFCGSGVPAAALGVNGSFYFRFDTPGTANQRLYVKSAGAWVGIL